MVEKQQRFKNLVHRVFKHTLVDRKESNADMFP